MACSLPVARSLAETFTMPLASMSKLTSICGTFRDAGRDGCAGRHDLVGVDALGRLLAPGELLDHLLDHGHAGRAADEDHVVDGARVLAPVLDRLVEGPGAGLHEILGHALELGAAE